MAKPRWRPIFRRLDREDWADWVVPAVVAALWAGLLVWTRGRGLGLQRTLVALGGPTVLLAGLHARLFPYLHAPSRQLTLVLPIPGAEHFWAARAPHRWAFLRAFAVGTLALVLALGGDLRTPIGLALVGDWAAFALIAAGLEPAIPALGAVLGRRFPPDSFPATLQRNLGGGWTLPEAVVHLYAPALGLGVAMALALPAQLTLDRLADGLPIPSGLLSASLVGLALGLGVAPLLAPRVYASGVFEAVPFLAEATKTLAGPAIPEPAPRWIGWLPSPVVRLWALQFVRLTPVPTLRFLVLIAAMLLARRIPSVPVGLAIVLAASLLWLMPVRAITRLQSARQRWLAALPVSAAARSGRCREAAALLLLPVLLALSLTVLGSAVSP